jgi:hypothetical protein
MLNNSYTADNCQLFEGFEKFRTMNFSNFLNSKNNSNNFYGYKVGNCHG